jgi:hypothetical protein
MTVILVAVSFSGVLSCGGGSSGGSKPLSLPALPAAPTQAGCTGTAIGGVEININTPATITVFGETFNIQEASGQAAFKIQRNVVPCDYELVGQLRPGNFNTIIGFTRTTDPRNDTGGIEAGSLVVDQGGTGTPSSQNPCNLNVNGSSFRIRFKVVASNGCGPR